MRGDGTENNPFIPETLTEFIQAVGTSGAYVALDRNINAAEDPNYGGELTEPVTWAASVEGGGFSLRGLTLRTAVTPISFAKGITIDGLTLEVGFKWAARFDILTAYGSGAKPLFTGCRFCVKLDVSTSVGSFADELFFQDCALSISSTAGAAGRSDFFWTCDFLRTTIYFPTEVLRGGGAGAILGTACSFVRSAVVFDALTDSTGQITLIGDAAGEISYSYAAIRENSGTVRISRSASSCIIALDPSAAISGSLSGWTRATLAQMRDEAWLASVGFLP